MSKSYLRFWGVRGSYPAPFSSHMRIGGNTPCVELRLGSHRVILDAGTGIIPLGNEITERGDDKQLHVFLSHYHWDHICGLPFFAPAFERDFEIDFFGPARTPGELENHIAQQMRAPYFPIGTATWRARVRYHSLRHEQVDVGPAAVSSFALHHPGLTYGYRIEVLGKRIVYAPDNEILFVNRRIDDSQSAFDNEERALLEQMKTEQRDRIIELMQDADILIHDAQYTSQDYERKRGWGHSCYIATVNCAIDAGVRHLFPFSYDPLYDDAQLDRLIERARDIVAERQAATVCHKTCEGMIIELDE